MPLHNQPQAVRSYHNSSSSLPCHGTMVLLGSWCGTGKMAARSARRRRQWRQQPQLMQARGTRLLLLLVLLGCLRVLAQLTSCLHHQQLGSSLTCLERLSPQPHKVSNTRACIHLSMCKPAIHPNDLPCMLVVILAEC